MRMAIGDGPDARYLHLGVQPGSSPMAGSAAKAHDANMNTTMADEPPPSPPPSPPPAEPPPHQRIGRRLARSSDDRMLCGVAGGIAHTYGWDAGLVRVVIAVASVITGGAIGVAYGIAWMVLPEETTGITGADAMRDRRAHRARENWALPVGVVLVAAGMLGVAHRFAWGPFSDLFWPITLIAGGLAVLLVRHRDHNPPLGPVDPTAPTPPGSDD